MKTDVRKPTPLFGLTGIAIAPKTIPSIVRKSGAFRMFDGLLSTLDDLVLVVVLVDGGARCTKCTTLPSTSRK